MNYILRVDIIEPLAELFYYLPYCLATKLIVVNDVLKRPSLDKLSDDIHLAEWLAVVDKLDDVPVHEAFEEVGLLHDHLQWRFPDFELIYDFDGYFLFGEAIHTLEDNAERSLADLPARHVVLLDEVFGVEKVIENFFELKILGGNFTKKFEPRIHINNIISSANLDESYLIGFVCKIKQTK